ncbi:hypothetical protein GQ457_02G019840 [Hibiscus cannabinus]
MYSRHFLGFFPFVFLHLCLARRILMDRAFIYKGFLTSEECDHLITMAKDKLEKSMVSDNEENYIMLLLFIYRMKLLLILNPGLRHGLPSDRTSSTKSWVVTVCATVLMYLSDVESGGETVFPNAEGALTQVKDESWSDCAKNGFAVKPRKGDALLFFSLHPDASTDAESLHRSCPVMKGEKWAATKWIHVRAFRRWRKHSSSNRRSAMGKCVDKNEKCR